MLPVELKTCSLSQRIKTLLVPTLMLTSSTTNDMVKKNLTSSMSYRVYIRNDYKPEIRWYPDCPWYKRKLNWFLCFGFFSLVSIYLLIEPTQYDYFTRTLLAEESVLVASQDLIHSQAQVETLLPNNESSQDEWQTVTVKAGENLSLIFDRLHISPAILFQVVSLGDETASLQRLIPGEQIQLRISDGKLQALRYEPDLTTTLLVTAEDNKYRSETITTELETRVKESTGLIQDSLYQAGLDAGLSDNLIMRFISIYGWDIDFALDIRKGDHFKVIYEERFKHGKKVGDGSILVTEFNNQGKNLRAVRYTSLDGQIGYFNEDGYSMRKAFLRTPLKFNRISSGFSLSRKHPILNRMRAHKGVDYAAPSGTPVKATGDGNVVEIGKSGGYGNMIVLRHAGIYNTVYAHLLGYAKGLKRGQHVEQGDIIGYVGKTGLATGPHLHYEFRVSGVHQNPLTVDLPKALKIADKQMQHFHQQTLPLFAQLDRNRQTDYAVVETEDKNDLVLALDTAEKIRNTR